MQANVEAHAQTEKTCLGARASGWNESAFSASLGPSEWWGCTILKGPAYHECGCPFNTVTSLPWSSSLRFRSTMAFITSLLWFVAKISAYGIKYCRGILSVVGEVEIADNFKDQNHIGKQRTQWEPPTFLADRPCLHVIWHDRLPPHCVGKVYK